MPHIPTSIRAALGLAATAVAEARRLPETLPQLPVTAVSTAMQASLRVQQHIATFAARGDEVISQLRGTSAEPPSWATFDDSPAASAVAAAKSGAADAAGAAKAAFDRATPDLVNLEDTGSGLAESDGAQPSRSQPGAFEPAHTVDTGTIDTGTATPGQPAMSINPTGDAPPAKKAPVKTANAVAKKVTGAKAAAKAPAAKAKAPAAKAPAAKATAKAPAAKAPAAKAPAKKTPGKKAPAKKAAKRSEPLVEAAKKADPSAGPNPSTMAAEILHAHQGEAPTEQ